MWLRSLTDIVHVIHWKSSQIMMQERIFTNKLGLSIFWGGYTFAAEKIIAKDETENNSFCNRLLSHSF